MFLQLHHKERVMVDDKALLKLLATGIGEEAVAAQLNISPKQVHQYLRIYLTAGILKCTSEREVIDWKAFGQWKKEQAAAQAAEAA
jgi:hypothetical protein